VVNYLEANKQKTAQFSNSERGNLLAELLCIDTTAQWVYGWRGELVAAIVARVLSI